MIIQYRNIYDEIVSSQQTSMLERYVEVHMDSNTQLKKIENKFLNGILVFIKYYIETSENEVDKINELKANCSSFSLVSREAYNSYIIENVKEFRDDTMLFKLRYLVDSMDNKICWEELDIPTNQPLYGNTEKFLFDSSGIELLEAHYNPDGSLDYIIYKMSEFNEEDWEYYDQSNFSLLQVKFSQDLSYYQTAVLESPSLG